jgi:DNA-binding GntR family transcriptional regulator
MEPGAPLDFSIERTSTVDQVADRLRSMIWLGELLPGYRLREVPLAQSFGVSRNTIRDAIRELATEGLVTHELHRGALVASLDASDVRDLYAVRRLLELNAVSRASQAHLEPVADAVELMERAVQAGDWEAMVEADGRFHQALVAMLGSPRLNRFFEQIGAEFRFAIGVLSFQDAADRAAGSPDGTELSQLAAEHREIYDLLASRRKADARRALEVHLSENERRLIEILDARSALTD